MSKLEWFQMDENGAGWTDAPLSVGDEVETALALAAGEVQLLCWVCLTPIPGGTGFACTAHKNVR